MPETATEPTPTILDLHRSLPPRAQAAISGMAMVQKTASWEKVVNLVHEGDAAETVYVLQRLHHPPAVTPGPWPKPDLLPSLATAIIHTMLSRSNRLVSVFRGLNDLENETAATEEKTGIKHAIPCLKATVGLAAVCAKSVWTEHNVTDYGLAIAKLLYQPDLDLEALKAYWGTKGRTDAGQIIKYMLNQVLKPLDAKPRKGSSVRLQADEWEERHSTLVIFGEVLGHMLSLIEKDQQPARYMESAGTSVCQGLFLPLFASEVVPCIIGGCSTKDKFRIGSQWGNRAIELFQQIPE